MSKAISARLDRLETAVQAKAVYTRRGVLSEITRAVKGLRGAEAVLMALGMSMKACPTGGVDIFMEWVDAQPADEQRFAKDFIKGLAEDIRASRSEGEQLRALKNYIEAKGLDSV